MQDLSKGIPEKWRLFFKLFCFINPQNVPVDSIEAAFMYEQVCMYVCMDVCYVHVFVCVYVCMYVCMCVCMY